MKRASGRPKDLIEVEVLTALQDETGPAPERKVRFDEGTKR